MGEKITSLGQQAFRAAQLTADYVNGHDLSQPHMGFPGGESVEKAGIQAVIINGIMTVTMGSDTMKNYPQFSSINNIRQYARQQLRAVLDSDLKALDNDPNSRISKIHRRLDEICGGGGSSRQIIAGINTAVYSMSKLLEIIPALSLPSASVADIMQVARSSYPFIARLATNKDGNFNHTMYLLSGQDCSEPGFDENIPWRKDALVIKDGRVDFSDNVTPSMKSPGIPAKGVLYMANMPCPAMWNPGFGEETSIKRLYSWFVDRAMPIYQQSRR